MLFIVLFVGAIAYVIGLAATQKFAIIYNRSRCKSKYHEPHSCVNDHLLTSWVIAIFWPIVGIVLLIAAIGYSLFFLPWLGGRKLGTWAENWVTK